MKRTLALLLGLLAVTPLLAAERQRYLVASPKGGASVAKLHVTSDAVEVAERHVRTFRNIDAFAADLTAEEAADLRTSSGMLVEPILEREALDDGSTAARSDSSTDDGRDVAQTTPWGLLNIHAPDVWKVTRGENVNVAVLDTGIDATHPDLADAYAGGYNTFDATKAPVDGHRHGTHVAGTIAAADNAFGVVGVAPHVKIWAVKVLDDEGKGSNETIVAGFDWVVEKAKTTQGRWAMNLSLGSNLPSEIEQLAVERAISANIVVVASAGNRAIDELKYPAKYRGVIAVGATDDQNKRAPFSSYGLGLTIMAPGAEVTSTFIKGVEVSADVKAGAKTLEAWRVNGSPYDSVTAKIVDCSYGEPADFPWDIAGRVALIRRGKLKFREMARNAKQAGAAALIIETYEEDRAPSGGWTMIPVEPDAEWENYEFPLTVGVLYETGEKLLQDGGNVTVDYRTARYGTMNGTSMASPHVTGTVALLLSVDPTLPVAQVDYVLRMTARDIYGSGWDYESAWGIIDAFAAAKFVAPEKFGVPPTPIPLSPHRRASR